MRKENYYEILNIPYNASTKEILSALEVYYQKQRLDYELQYYKVSEALINILNKNNLYPNNQPNSLVKNNDNSLEKFLAVDKTKSYADNYLLKKQQIRNNYRQSLRNIKHMKQVLTNKDLRKEYNQKNIYIILNLEIKYLHKHFQNLINQVYSLQCNEIYLLPDLFKSLLFNELNKSLNLEDSSFEIDYSILTNNVFLQRRIQMEFNKMIMDYVNLFNFLLETWGRLDKSLSQIEQILSSNNFIYEDEKETFIH